MSEVNSAEAGCHLAVAGWHACLSLSSFSVRGMGDGAQLLSSYRRPQFSSWCLRSYKWLTTSCNSGSMGSSALLWPPWVPTLMYTDTHTYIIKNRKHVFPTITLWIRLHTHSHPSTTPNSTPVSPVLPDY